MKRLLQMFLLISLVSALLLYAISKLNSAQGFTSSNTLTIYNWGDYIDDSANRDGDDRFLTPVSKSFDRDRILTVADDIPPAAEVTLPGFVAGDQGGSRPLVIFFRKVQTENKSSFENFDM